ncbi:MAG: hypothetical protein AAF404_06010, partial [Pseudomonadota bacterium]
MQQQVNRLVVIFCLLFTFMLGPVGMLMYGAVFTASYVVNTVEQPVTPDHALWQRIVAGQSALAQCGVFLLLLLPVLSVAMVMDTGTVLDANVWVKPVKFSVALIIYTLTLSWYAVYLAPQWRSSQWFRTFSVLAVVAILLEMAWLIYASSIGEPSHFNQQHPTLARVYPVMGLVAVILTAQSLVVGVGLLKHRLPQLTEVTRYSLAYGLIATFVLTLITAGYMASAPAQTHAVLQDGATRAASRSLPWLGWLRSVGDLRVAHFFCHPRHALCAACRVGHCTHCR